jgi:hypothetical protein
MVSQKAIDDFSKALNAFAEYIDKEKPTSLQITGDCARGFTESNTSNKESLLEAFNN